MKGVSALKVLTAEPWADHSLKGVDLSVWHFVTASEIMSWEQEHVLNTSLLPGLQKSLCTTFRWAEQSKRIGNLPRSIFRDRHGIVRWLKREADLLEPVKIRCARIGEKGLTWSEPASHPSGPHLSVVSQSESDHEYHRKGR